MDYASGCMLPVYPCKKVDILGRIEDNQLVNKKPAIIKELATNGLKLDYNIFAKELSEAEYSLGLLEGSQKKLHNPTLLISPLTAKEAATSSKIEGTQSDVSDVFMFEAGAVPRYSDAREVVNYRKAMQSAMEELQKGRSVSSHLIKTLHGVLLEDVRHKGDLGKFRDRQVWIAEHPGDKLEDALYVPPETIHVDALIDNLIKYINNGEENALVKAGIAHYQFEAVHPFSDGNGRIGRLLIPLVLYRHQKLSSPILYLSGYLEEHREEYISKLHAVDEGGSLEIWLKFYLHSVAEQLKQTQQIIEDIYSLYDKIKAEEFKIKSPYMLPFIDMLFMSPIFTIKSVREYTGASSKNTCLSLIKVLRDRGYLEEIGTVKREKLFRFTQLLKIIK